MECAGRRRVRGRPGGDPEVRLTPHMTPLQFLTESNRMWALGAAGFAVNRLLDLLAAQADEEPVT